MEKSRQRKKKTTFSSPNFTWKLWIWSKLINQASFIIKQQERVLMLVISLYFDAYGMNHNQTGGIYTSL